MSRRLAVVVACCACRASSPEPGPIVGPPAGLAEITTSARGTALDLTLTSTETCAAVTEGPHAREEFVELFLFAHAPADALDTAASRPGVYHLDRRGPGPYAEADRTTLGAACEPDPSPRPFTGGTVTITAIATTGAVAGTYDLTAAGDHLTGSFTAMSCPGANALTNATAGHCHE